MIAVFWTGVAMLVVATLIAFFGTLGAYRINSPLDDFMLNVFFGFLFVGIFTTSVGALGVVL